MTEWNDERGTMNDERGRWHIVHRSSFIVAAALLFATSTIAQALAVQEQPRQTLAEMLARHLRDKKLLLVLDNFEQILDAAPTIGELLRNERAA